MDDMTTPEPSNAPESFPAQASQASQTASQPSPAPSASSASSAESAPVWSEPQLGPSSPAQAGVSPWTGPGSVAGPLSASAAGPLSASQAGPPYSAAHAQSGPLAASQPSPLAASASGPLPAPAPGPFPGPDPAAFPAPDWAAAAQPGVDPAVPPAPKPRRQRKPIGTGRILIGVGALVSIAIGGGVGALIVHNKNQDNQKVIAQAQAAVGTKPQPQTAGVRADGSHYGPLFAYLLPIPSGYTLGPGDADYGNNSYLTQAQIKSDFDGLLSGLPQSDMSSAKGSLSDLSIKAVAVRTYSNVSTSLVVEVELIQSDVADAAKTTSGFESTISDTDVFRQGPSVPGYSQATCVLPPGLGSDTIDSMICLATSGDIEVRVFTYGTAPLDTDSITQLVSQQLALLKTSQTIG